MAIRVLVVDDSAFMRKVISDIVNNDPHLEVVGKACLLYTSPSFPPG